MKKHFLITGTLLLTLLAACEPESPTTGATGGAGGTGGRQAAAEGEFCGGIAGILCDENLRCELDGDYPDAGGVCVRDNG